MPDTVTLGDSTHFWRIVCLRSEDDCALPFRKTAEWPVASHGKAENHRDEWKNAGEQADSVAQHVQDCLDRLTDGWTGKGAKAFEKKVDQVIYFARQLAHQCDSQKYSEPKPPEDDEEGPSGPEAPTSTSGKGYVQIWDAIVDALKDAKTEESNPTYPWCKEQFTMYAGVGFPAGLFYEIYDSSGTALELPAWGNQTSIDEADLWIEYNKCWDRSGDRPDPLVESGHLVMDKVEDVGSTSVSEDGTSAGHTFFPATDKRYEEFFVHMKLNKTEAETSRETIETLLEAYAAVTEEPQAPEAPKLFSEEDGDGTNGGGPGPSGSTGGSMGGGPGAPTTGGGPSPDEITGGPDSDDIGGPGDGEDAGKPRDGNEEYETIDRRAGGPGDGPGDGPGGPNGPGMPDENTGFPGPGRDIGTETARVGGGPGTLGGGPGSGTLGGPGAGGGPGGSNLPGAGGAAGVAPGAAGGPGGALGGPGGAGAGRAGMGGTGMMPMAGGGMGGGAGEGGDEGDRDAWLDEDEDVWGAGGDAPPPVLGGSL